MERVVAADDVAALSGQRDAVGDCPGKVGEDAQPRVPNLRQTRVFEALEEDQRAVAGDGEAVREVEWRQLEHLGVAAAGRYLHDAPCRDVWILRAGVGDVERPVGCESRPVRADEAFSSCTVAPGLEPAGRVETANRGRAGVADIDRSGRVEA